MKETLIPQCVDLGLLLGAEIDNMGADAVYIALEGASDMRNVEIVGSR